jgi:hypothetical protein
MDVRSTARSKCPSCGRCLDRGTTEALAAFCPRRDAGRRISSNPRTGPSSASSTSPRKGSSPTRGPSPDSDTTLLLGWVGWGHKDQAQALVNLVIDRTEQVGWDADKLMPLLAGLAEAMPWAKQWHGELDEEWVGVPAEEFQAFLDDQRTEYALSLGDLTKWRPTASTRRRASAG